MTTIDNPGPETMVGGLYIHHDTGNRYVVLSCDGQDSNNDRRQDPTVEYMSIEPGPRQGKKRYRRVSEFHESVKWPDGQMRPRFTYEFNIK